MTQTLGPLSDGSKVVIIGGGPGGTASALALHSLSSQLNRRITITVIEGKQFSEGRHYNQCAGVLSPLLPSLLNNQLGVKFPNHLAHVKIPGYVLHTRNEEILLTDENQPSTSLRRVQFDEYMLESVKQRKIDVLSTRVVDLDVHTNGVRVYTESGSIEADVIVGAFGLDDGSASIFKRLISYKPPLALSSVVTKYHPGHKTMADFGPNIHAFLPSHPRIEFGAITPKRDHLTINIAGLSVDVPLMRHFLNQPLVSSILKISNGTGSSNPNDFQFFKGRFPRSLAKNYYGDRYVMVGDAAGLVRAFKGKGVTSAILTSTRAAETILKHGISKRAFHDNFRLANKDITEDLPYGRGMRLMAISCARFGLLDPVLRAAKNNAILRSALLDAVSAHAPYRDVIVKTLRPGPIFAVMREMLSFSSSAM